VVTHAAAFTAYPFPVCVVGFMCRDRKPGDSSRRHTQPESQQQQEQQQQQAQQQPQQQQSNGLTADQQAEAHKKKREAEQVRAALYACAGRAGCCVLVLGAQKNAVGGFLGKWGLLQRSWGCRQLVALAFEQNPAGGYCGCVAVCCEEQQVHTSLLSSRNMLFCEVLCRDVPCHCCSAAGCS
jgi:hypothetical protein